MIIVIVAGGSGSRLWPLSTPDYPKHLLKVNGDDHTLLQNTYLRAKELSDKIYVVSEVGHMHHVREQLAELPESAFITEPARRGTAHAILAALVEIGKHHPADEPIASIHADHYIRDTAGFVQSFLIAETAAEREARIVLVGVEPDYPATGFGYIQKGKLLDDQGLVSDVVSFKEKPDYKTAQKYVKSGNYLWNCGYFVGTIDTFKKAMQTNAPELYASYQSLVTATDKTYEQTYLDLATITIDYGLIEKVPDLLVTPAAFDWMDLGSFNDLSKAVDYDEQGNHVSGASVELEEVENSFVQNYEDRPVAVIGLDNVVVVNTPQGILVARKDLSQKVGDVSKRFKKEL